MTNKQAITPRESAIHSSEAERLDRRPVVRPRTDIIETDSSVLLRADMPGVDEKNLEITVEKNMLRVRGEVKAPKEKNRSIAFQEYELADYERAFLLSNEVDRDKIEARLRHGVLELRLPKAVYAQAKKIPISTG